MGWFKKRGPEIVDLTKLREKGTLQRSNELAKKNEKKLENEDEVVDLSNMNFNSNSSSESVSNSGSSDEGGALGFLTNMASVGSGGESNSGISAEPELNVTRNLRDARRNNIDVSGLKNKIEDMEYKLDRFIERLDKIEEKLGGL